MPLLLFIFLLFPSFVFAGDGQWHIVWLQISSNTIGCKLTAGSRKYKVTTTSDASGQQLFQCEVYSGTNPCDSPQVWNQTEDGKGSSCVDPQDSNSLNDCPLGYSKTGATGGAVCVDSQGCSVNQTFVGPSNGMCASGSLKDRIDKCHAIASYGGQKSTLTINQDGTSTCTVGATSSVIGNETAAQCQQQSGTSCFANPIDANGKPGWQCGTFNGKATCVASASTGAVGVGSASLGSSTTSGKVKTITEQVTEGNITTTTTTDITPQTTSTTTLYNPMVPLKEGEVSEPTAGTAPPYICSDGRAAANLISCDTSKTCPVGFYLAYGSCIQLPTKTLTESKDVSVVTITKKDNSTGLTTSSTSTTSSISTPVKNPTIPGTSETQRTGQCDPTAKNYFECVGVLSQVSPTLQSETKTANDSAFSQSITDKDNAEKTAIASTAASQLNANTNGIKSILNPLTSFFQTATCVPLSSTIGTRTFTVSCDVSTKIKASLAFIFYIYTIFHIYQLFFRSQT